MRPSLIFLMPAKSGEAAPVVVDAGAFLCLGRAPARGASGKEGGRDPAIGL